MMEKSESSRKEENVIFPPMKPGATYINKEREKVSSVNSSSNSETGYSKNSQNEDMTNPISV